MHKNRKNRNKYIRDWYRRNFKNPEFRKGIAKRARSTTANIKKFLAEYKLERGCSDCGYKNHHVALQFDHVRGEKEREVCKAKSIGAAKREIEKCEVVCANCHSIRTYSRLRKT